MKVSGVIEDNKIQIRAPPGFTSGTSFFSVTKSGMVFYLYCLIEEKKFAPQHKVQLQISAI
jgi:hypothetical protein